MPMAMPTQARFSRDETLSDKNMYFSIQDCGNLLSPIAQLGYALKRFRLVQEALLREVLPKQREAWVIDRKAVAAKRVFVALGM